MFAAYIVLLTLIHICYCSHSNNFYHNENLAEVSADTSSVLLSHVIDIELDECDETVVTLNISAAGTVDFFPSGQQHISGNSSMRFYPLSVNPGNIDSGTIKHIARAGFTMTNYSTQLFAPFDAAFRNYSQFEPTYYTIIEWKIEKSNGSSTNDMVNLFQMFFATNGTSSLVEFLYDKHLLQWGNPSMGIDVCDQKWEHPSSYMKGILNILANGSNINVTGQWMFMIENGKLIEPTPCSVGCSFITGTCSEPNTCSCVSGWEGVNCTTPSCPGGCVNGMCNKSFNCTCSDGWEGDNCTNPICTSSCGIGRCVAPDKCEYSYNGNTCDEIVCYNHTNTNKCENPGKYTCNNVKSTGDLPTRCHIELPQPSTALTAKPSATTNRLTTPRNTPTNEVTDTPGTIEESSEDLSGAAIGGIVAGVIGFVVLIILLVFFIVCVLCCFYS